MVANEEGEKRGRKRNRRGEKLYKYRIKNVLVRSINKTLE